MKRFFPKEDVKRIPHKRHYFTAIGLSSVKTMGGARGGGEEQLPLVLLPLYLAAPPRRNFDGDKVPSDNDTHAKV